MFFKFLKGKKWPKMTKKKNCLTPCLRNCASYDCVFWCTCVKWWYLQQFFFSFFQNSDFSGFSKFINKCQNEILSCAPPSSHVCDFSIIIRSLWFILFIHWDCLHSHLKMQYLLLDNLWRYNGWSQPEL